MTYEENEKRLAYLKNIVLNMPDKPGSYQFYDEEHIIIYVGKAKRLKQRVSSYFHKEVDRFKTKVLVSKIRDISYTVVNTEEDALLLENSLIKNTIHGTTFYLRMERHIQVFASPTNTFRGYLRPELSTKIMELTMAPSHISEA